MPRPPSLHLAQLAAFGAVAGSFFDGFHTHGGATAYPHPLVLEMAWWTPALFGATAVLIGVTYGALQQRFKSASPPLSRMLPGFAVFGALYFASGYWHVDHALRLALLVAGSAALWRFVDPTRAALVTSLIAAVVGPMTEIVLIHIGAFAHLEPDFAGIPSWLPGLYLAAGPGAGALAWKILRS